MAQVTFRPDPTQFAQSIGYSLTFLLLGGLGLASTALWLTFGAAVKKH